MLRRMALKLTAFAAAGVAAGNAVAQSGSAGRIEARLKELNIVLPPSGPAPVANYVPTLRNGNMVYISGQIPFKAPGELLFKGRVGAELTFDQGKAAARLVGINMLALLKREIGDLDRVERVLRIDGFISSDDNFTQQPHVLNGISDLMVDVFGDAGRHTRTAVGVNILPLNAPCEINAEFAIKA